MPDSPTYRCACCGGSYDFGDDDIARSEAERTCAGGAVEDRVTVCDPCFVAMQSETDATFVAGPILQ